MDPQDLQRRCPRLGSEVAFAYCMTCAEDTDPCFKIGDCWWERFDVMAYLEARLPAAVYRRIAVRRPPPDKVCSLVALIRQAQARVAKP